MRTLIIIGAAVAATGCTEKPVETASRKATDAMVEQSTRMMHARTR